MKKKIIVIILVIVAVILAALAVRDYFKEKNAGAGYEQLKEEVKKDISESSSDEDGTSSEDTTSESDGTSVEVPIDFDALQAQNPDVYAWIYIDGTQVDYPILQHEGDDQYYLHRDINGNYEYAGCIFTEGTYNTKTFEDKNTVIYGHAMKNGTMFRSIKNFMEKDFFDSHKEILIYMPGKILHYTVFAGYLYDDRHLMQSFDFDDPEVFEYYINNILTMTDMNANIDKDAVITSDDKIITLSTCYDAAGVQRFLLQAVLSEVEE